MLVLLGGMTHEPCGPRGWSSRDLSARSAVPIPARYRAGIGFVAIYLGLGVVIFAPAGERTCQMLRTP